MKSPFYTAEHEAFREAMRRFVEKEIEPYAHGWDEAGEFPRVLYAKAAEIGLLGLVGRFIQIDGYRCLSLMRAFLVVNCQSALVRLVFRSCCHAAISSMRVCLSGIRRSRHCLVRTPSSDSARLSQLPCFGV